MSETDLTSGSDRNPVEMLAEEFVERQRRGERPSLSEYTRKYPELAEAIVDLFPALVVMERVKPAAEGRPASGGPDASSRTDLLRPATSQLGDFRILREVARGGMGVVYEAVQESLGRHVALKILPLTGRLSSTQLQRFQLEARSAGRLHHGNIVPVYGVGEHEGVHYYAMQFIMGTAWTRSSTTCGGSAAWPTATRQRDRRRQTQPAVAVPERFDGPGAFARGRRIREGRS